jgi:hypothetical protein
MPGNFIRGIGDGISGSIDKIKGSLKDLSDEYKKGPLPSGLFDIVKPIRTAELMVILKLQNIVSKVVFGKDAKDVNINMDTLAADVKKNMEKYRLIVNDPEFKKIFDEWSKGTTSTILKTLDLWQPNLDKVTGKIDNMITETSSHLGDTAGTALVNFLNNVIAAVPAVGAALNVVSTVGTLANKITETCTPIIKDATEVVFPAANAVSDTLDYAKCQAMFLEKKVEPVANRIDKAGAVGDEKKDENAKEGKKDEKKDEKKDKKKDKKSKKKGGAGDSNVTHEKMPTRKIKQHIQNTTKRIQKLLSHNFTRSKNPNRNPRKQMTVKNSYLRFARR